MIASIATRPTILIVHRRERRRKCTLNPLRSMTGLEIRFHNYPANVPSADELENYVRLSIDGPPLTEADADRGLLLIDATWKLSIPMHRMYDSVPARSLRGYRTAERRTSKVSEDPEEGLASIEALYIAHRILGRPTRGMLDGYRWADEFLARNGSLATS